MEGRLVQIGTAALRGPDGSFMEGVPLYIVTDRAQEVEESTAQCAAGLLADKFRQYVEALRK